MLIGGYRRFGIAYPSSRIKKSRKDAGKSWMNIVVRE
jgi:hypothetical protein